MATGNSYFLGINSNDFFLRDNKKAFILGLNVPKVTAYTTSCIVDMQYYFYSNIGVGLESNP
jgi:hypothetical protein